MSYGIVVSEFNPKITEALLEACLRGFKEQGLKPKVIRVSGAIEIPLALQDFILSRRPKAMVALGCVIKGETDHYEAVCRMVSQGVMDVMLKTHTPILFEVLMVKNLKQAKKRISKAYEAAYSAVRMGKLIRNVFE